MPPSRLGCSPGRVRPVTGVAPSLPGSAWLCGAGAAHGLHYHRRDLQCSFEHAAGKPGILILQAGYADEDALHRIQDLATSVLGEIRRRDVA
jgi:hypothetical protein